MMRHSCARMVLHDDPGSQATFSDGQLLVFVERKDARTQGRSAARCTCAGAPARRPRTRQQLLLS